MLCITISSTSPVNEQEGRGVIDCSHQPSEQEGSEQGGSGCFGLFTLVNRKEVNRKEVGVLDCSHQPSPVNRKEVSVLDCSHQPSEQEGSEQEGSGCFGLFTLVNRKEVNRKEVGVWDCSH